MEKPVIALCEYVAQFERVALKESEWKPNLWFMMTTPALNWMSKMKNSDKFS